MLLTCCNPRYRLKDEAITLPPRITCSRLLLVFLNSQFDDCLSSEIVCSKLGCSRKKSSQDVGGVDRLTHRDDRNEARKLRFVMDQPSRPRAIAIHFDSLDDEWQRAVRRGWLSVVVFDLLLTRPMQRHSLRKQLDG